MKRLLVGLAAAISLIAAPVLAAPIPYLTTPADVPQVMVNQAINNVNTALAPAAQLVTGSFSSNALTLNGSRFSVTTASLSTGTSATATTQTLTDSSILANTVLVCSISYAGTTGVPVLSNATPAAGSATFVIQNVSTGASLNGTVTINCLAQN